MRVHRRAGVWGSLVVLSVFLASALGCGDVPVGSLMEIASDVLQGSGYGLDGLGGFSPGLGIDQYNAGGSGSSGGWTGSNHGGSSGGSSQSGGPGGSGQSSPSGGSGTSGDNTTTGGAGDSSGSSGGNNDDADRDGRVRVTITNNSDDIQNVRVSIEFHSETVVLQPKSQWMETYSLGDVGWGYVTFFQLLDLNTGEVLLENQNFHVDSGLTSVVYYEF